ncbi:MAG TPA: hypothetical protein VIV40_41400, partial [Kofleriaceae bacterium]
HARGLSLAAAVALIARRIELRLLGRGRAAARLDIIAIGAGGGPGPREVPVTLAEGLADAEPLGHVITTALESITAEHAIAHDEWRLRVIVAGEQILGAETTEIFAEGSQRYGESSIYAAPGETSSSATAVAHSARRGVSQLREHDLYRRGADHPAAQSSDPGDLNRGAHLGPLAVVLSSSGSLFALSPPTLRAERRDAHRGTRRGKQRRSRPTPLAQPRLFDRTSSKG